MTHTGNTNEAKRNPRFVAIGLGILIGLTPIHASAQIAGDVSGLLTEIQNALVAVRDKAEDETLPELSKVTLKLRTAFTKGKDGTLSLVIVKFGTKIRREHVMEVVLELLPPKEGDMIPSSATSDLLSHAILQSATAVKHAQQSEPPLHLSALRATVRFLISTNRGGGVEFQLLPLSFGTSKDFRTDEVHEIVVEFKDREG